jgi:general secretion pathway protein G
MKLRNVSDMDVNGTTRDCRASLPAALRMGGGQFDRTAGSASARGFTLVEMLLVLVILATLAAVVIPKFAGRSRQAKETAATSQIANLEMAIDSFEVDNGYYPRDLLELIERPNNALDWRGPYMKKGLPPDPWGNEYIYRYPGQRNVDGYDLMSMGADGRVGGDDDIGNWLEERRR